MEPWGTNRGTCCGRELQVVCVVVDVKVGWGGDWGRGGKVGLVVAKLEWRGGWGGFGERGGNFGMGGSFWGLVGVGGLWCFRGLEVVFCVGKELCVFLRRRRVEPWRWMVVVEEEERILLFCVSL